MLEAFREVRRAQVQFTSTRALAVARALHEDWSTQAVRLVERGDYRDAELVARAELESSRDAQAFLLMVQASYREGRYFDCIRDLEARPDVVDAQSPAGAELRRLALSAISRCGKWTGHEPSSRGAWPRRLMRPTCC
jgi:serine/threonine-protein kinase